MKKFSRILAIALCIALVMTSVAFAATPPSDVTSTSLKTAVSALMDAGAITGDTDGLFHPEQTLNRATVLTMIVKLVDADGADTIVEPFNDLKGYGWAAPYIKYANINGVTNGYRDGTFKPGKTVTFAELAAFAVQAAGYSNLDGKWPTNYINKAKSLGFLKGVTVPKNVNTAATKGDAALVLYNAMANIKAPAVGKQYVVRDDWDPIVKKGINDLIATYGKDSPKHTGNEYAVFDFDDTCAIYDVAVAERYWRLQHMQFAFTPEDLPKLLDACFGNADVARSASASYCDDKQPHSYQDWYDDIQVAYKYLWKTYGPFSHEPVEGEKLETMLADPYWVEFATKFQVVFKVVNSAEGDYPSYPWYKYWNYGMTEDEAYSVSAYAFEGQKNLPTKSVKWQTTLQNTKVGTVGTSWTEGVSVAANMVELWKALDDNGIDVWINSASGTTQIRAAVDVLGGGHNSVTGIIAYTADIQDGQRTPDSLIGPEKAWTTWYDWDGGTAWVTTDDYTLYNGWKPATLPIHTDTVQLGKTTAINNALVPIYGGHGPVAAFGDSAGDFEMMSMYKSLKLVMVSNAGKSITSFHLGNIALYQKEVLGWNLAEANAAGETLYVLQGRNLNGERSFIAGDELIKLGKDSGTATTDDAKTAIELEWMKTQGTDIKACIDTLCIKTSAGAKNNVLGDTGYGYRNYYGGYHSLVFAD